MDHGRFDTIVQTLSAARSRRQTVRLVVAAALGLDPARAGLLPAKAAESTCRPADRRCKKGNQCCSGRCQKRKGKRNGKRNGTCSSLGPFAANCPRVETCFMETQDTECHVGETAGACTALASGEPFCAFAASCGPDPVCATDADCPNEIGHPDAKCLPCASEDCAGVMCAIYAGDV